MKHLRIKNSRHKETGFNYPKAFKMLIIAFLFSFVSIYYLYYLFTFGITELPLEVLLLGLGMFSLSIILYIAAIQEYAIAKLSKKTDKIRAIPNSYVDFYDSHLELCIDANSKLQMGYDNITEIELIIKNNIIGNKRVQLYGFILNIKYRDGDLERNFSITENVSFCFVSKIFKILYFSKYVKNFYYTFTHDDNLVQSLLGCSMELFIKNNYKHTIKSYINTPNGKAIAIVIIALVIIIFSLIQSV